MAAGYGGVTTQAPVRQATERSAQWTHLHERFDRAHDATQKMLNELSERLGGVLSPPDPVPTVDSNKMEAALVPLLESLHAHARRAEDMNAILANILDRLAF